MKLKGAKGTKDYPRCAKKIGDLQVWIGPIIGDLTALSYRQSYQGTCER